MVVFLLFVILGFTGILNHILPDLYEDVKEAEGTDKVFLRNIFGMYCAISFWIYVIFIYLLFTV